jgi:pimeloyl-ACP methyl ester carboxylesterase
LPCTTSLIVLSERLVLDGVPADADAQSQPAAGQEGYIGCLPCHECRLPLGKDQDAGDKTDSLGETRQIAEHHKRVMERVVLGVRTGELRRPIGVHGTEHVVIGEAVVEAHVLDRSPNASNRARISSKLVLGVHGADLHDLQSAMRRSRISGEAIGPPANWLLTLAFKLSTVAIMNTTTDPATAVQSTSYLTRPDGGVAYDIAGDGPLLVLVPGMGDLRGAYRFVAPELRDAGYRVACMDLRGHGDSDATFASYGDVETSGDIVSLIQELGGPAVIVGNSMAAGSAVIAAAEHPDLVRGLVLVGPFVRNGKMSAAQRILFRVAMAPLWAARAWKSYLPKLYAGKRPEDFDAYRDQVIAAIHRPGHAKAFSRTTHTNHDPAEALLGKVAARTLVVMGEQDPDFPDPKAEADWIRATLHADVVMVPEAGHYPQSQRPDITGNALLGFLKSLGGNA